MTREEKIEILEKEKAYMIGHGGDSQAKALDSAIKTLKQESVLDQIIAEIQRLRGCSCSCSDGIIDDVENIIDKYKESKE